MSRTFRTYAELEGGDGSNLAAQVAAQEERVARRAAGIERCVAVMSGKGGVGKSLVSSALAAAARMRGARVGLLDADLQGPSAGRMSGVAAAPLHIEGDVVRPLVSPTGVSVMSMEFLIADDAPLAWRGPAAAGFAWRGSQERGALREFIADVQWGDLDLLLVDLPPGTERLADLVDLLPRTAALAVTIPSAASRVSVARALVACRNRGAPVLGIVENMAGYACPGCREVRPLFPGAAGRQLAEKFDAPLLARVPFDPEAAACAERGDMEALVAGTPAGEALGAVAATVLSAPAPFEPEASGSRARPARAREAST